MKLEWYHYRTLEHAEKSSLTDLNYDDNIPALEEVGYLHGSWFGSLDYAPSRKWEITREGSKALKAYNLQKLIDNTSQCAEGACKGAYATECYLKTDCITCGRTIDRSVQEPLESLIPESISMPYLESKARQRGV